ncbi:hypothetical protein [Deinococcus knuensis]|uniref:DUF11 domain-containing protein n=1 Tax=Deinococcus knuensis TaxID=1837380 RepID=A0ABQ2SHD8_9DEIO|nr:hypothetical protein [Deinococcus knuensis]GGS28678.1 hypothetical protein GCM10008961_20430 [Deinococcus knuensis]
MNALKRALRSLTVLIAVLAGSGLLGPARAGSCSAVACVAAGPRLLSVDSTQSPILNALFGGLLGGGGVTLSAADWNAIANADIDLGLFLNALKTQTAVGTTSGALNADVSVLQFVNAAAQAAQTQGNTAAVNALNLLTPAVSGLSGTLKVGDLLKLEGDSAAFLTSKLNVLNLLTGGVQLFNYNNALTTGSSPITLNPVAVNLSGLGLGAGTTTPAVQVSLRVIEPPVYRCGPAGTSFNTAAIRAKLNVNLGGLNLNVPGLSGATLKLTTLNLYLEVAEASGTMSTVNAITDALSLNAQPGLAQLGLGQISDSVFFDRNKKDLTTPFATLTQAIIGTVDLSVSVPLVGSVPIVLNVKAKAFANGTYPLGTVNAAPPYPQTVTVGSSSAAVGTLVGTLLTSLGTPGNLTLELRDPAPLVPAALLTSTISSALGPVLNTLGVVLQPILEATLIATVDQVLRLLGVGIGEAVFTVGGVGNVCSVTGRVYHDLQPSGAPDAGEVWDGPATFVNAVSGGSVAASASVPAGAGTFSFSVGEGSYLVPVTTAATATAPAQPAGYVFVGPLSGQAAVTVANNTVSLADLEFGLFFGDRLTGRLFRDDGLGGGTPHDAAQQGTEAALSARTVTVQGSVGGAAQPARTGSTDGSGAYTLFVPGSWTGVTFAANPASTETLTGLTLNGASTLAASLTDPALTAFALPAPAGQDRTLNAGLTGRAALSPDRAARGEAPLSVTYAHTFTPGTPGTFTFASTGAFSAALYLDSDCDGTVQAGERTPVTGVTVTSDWPRDAQGALKGCALEVSVTSGAAAAGTVDAALITAASTWQGSALQDLASVTDTTTIAAGAVLSKTVQNLTASGTAGTVTTALPQDELRYCLTATNPGVDTLTGVILTDTLTGAATFVPGSLTLNGAALTDLTDTDAGEFVITTDTDGNPVRTVTVRLPDLTGLGSSSVCFDVQIP